MSSRRKACDRCIQSKRRCDLKRPCTRCAKRGFKCTFEPQQVKGPQTRAISSVSDNPSPQLQSVVEDSDVIDPWLNSTEFELLNSDSLTIELEECGNCPIYNHMPPTIINQMSPLRLHSCVRRLQKCITNMAQETKTPFLKVSPVVEAKDGEDSLHDAFLACTAYRNRTRHNSVFLNRTLYRSFLKLVCRLRTSIKLQEQLSTIQAILLFQIMFYFGDDDLLRKIAESHADTVASSVQLLQREYIERTDRLGTLEKTSVVTCRYYQWLFLESCRRTVIAHLYIKAIYQNLRDGYCDQVPCLAPLPLTVDGELWDAQSEEEWCEVMRMRKASVSMLIKPLADAVDIWTANDYENMDDFQMMLLDACKGAPPGR